MNDDTPESLKIGITVTASDGKQYRISFKEAEAIANGTSTKLPISADDLDSMRIQLREYFDRIRGVKENGIQNG